MIRVDVQPYCDNCLGFEPSIERPQKYFADNQAVAQTDTIIHCKYKTRCEAMVQWLRRQDI